MDEGQQLTPDKSYAIIALRFAATDAAAGWLDEVSRAARPLGYQALAQLLVEIDEDGKAAVHDPGNTGLGTALNATAQGALGEFGGPSGLLAWTVTTDTEQPGGREPVDPALLRALRDRLAAGTSALLLLIETGAADEITRRFEGEAETMSLPLSAELSADIAHALMASTDIGQWDRPAEGAA